ncbi:hypothetical protein [Plantibacter sp. MCCC 1A11337]|uniref:hypothetical protein n=1 Tax=Plantibacter sp. MCCC 1A11337 TaxID=2736644 RepID=UPI001581B010|nr:hypothetical protein [Plantibacter sp. MCCC 1A11337]
MPHAATKLLTPHVSTPVRRLRLRKREILLLIGAGVIDIAIHAVLARLTVDFAPQLVALFISSVMYGF